MSSIFSSTKAKCDSVKSRTITAHSQQGSVSEGPTLPSRHSKTSKSSSGSSSKISSTMSSNRSPGSSSKAASTKSLKHSSKPSHKQKSKLTLAEITAHDQSYDNSSQPAPAPVGRYATSSIRSNPRYITSSTPRTEAEYRARMQQLLDGIGPQWELNGMEMGLHDDAQVEVDQYDAELDLDEDDSEETL